ncbi:putative ankyrin repeat protein [Seiridium cardinale]
MAYQLRSIYRRIGYEDDMEELTKSTYLKSREMLNWHTDNLLPSPKASRRTTANSSTDRQYPTEALRKALDDLDPATGQLTAKLLSWSRKTIVK